MALAVSRVAASLLYGISAFDWVTFLLTPLLLIAVALVSVSHSGAPGLRVLNPIATLRYQ